MTLRRILFSFFCYAGLQVCLAVPLTTAASPPDNSHTSDTGLPVTPLLQKYCYQCHGNGKHKGDVTLDHWKTSSESIQDRKVWQQVLQVLQSHDMPPEEKPQPSLDERESIAKWIELTVFQCDCDHPDPGRVTLRRLNRAEYNNTIRDLVGVDFKPAEDFPVDDSGYGFDNIGDALSLPPVLLEKYLAAAQQILDQTLVFHEDMKPIKKQYSIDLLEVGYNAKLHGNGWVGLNSVEEDDVAVNQPSLKAGKYRVRVNAYAKQDGPDPMKVTFVLDENPIQAVSIETNALAPKMYEAELDIPSGKHRVRAVVRRVREMTPGDDPSKWRSSDLQKGVVFINQMEIEGPFEASSSLTETHRRIFFVQPEPGREINAARKILERFAGRAYRRPITSAELDRLATFVDGAWKRGEDFEHGVALALQAILVSPNFLFRGELQPEPDNPKSIHPINEYALASRLSYFLWSSMPDAELFAEAEHGTLRANIQKQVDRMLRDPKSRALVDDFAGQWLQLRNLKLASPDPELFPDFDETLRAAMLQETELFVEYIMQNNRSVLEFLNADYTFLNHRLALHYGIPSVEGSTFQRVSLKPSDHRRGLLTQASILTITSNPTRTSPVKRGKWILENILASPPPPPPPNVPLLSEAKDKTLHGTLRERMEQHRADPICASCHARMDPIGFSFENFNAIGGWRNQDGKFPIDPSGQLTTGETFKGAPELQDILQNQKKDQFVRCLTEKLLTYALGRGLEFYDKCALDQITKSLAKDDYKFSALVLHIVYSTPFQTRRGDGS